MSAAEPAGRRPILVTGTHRSGTTWVGHMLALSPQVHYVHEPFAPMYERSWLGTRLEVRYYHLPPAAVGAHLEDVRRIVMLRPPWLKIARRAGGIRNYARLAQEAIETALARARGARALIKDPFMLLSAEWLATHTGAEVVVLVRHPAAFASSIKRLGWRLDVRWLLKQRDLMQGDLEPFAAELGCAAEREADLIDHACLVWRALNSVIVRYARDHPDWHILRYEDLASEPVSRFAALYGDLGIHWNRRAARRIAEHNSPRHRADVDPSGKGGTRRDSSKAMWTWVHRLLPDEVQRIYDQTHALARNWYSDQDWHPEAARTSPHFAG